MSSPCLRRCQIATVGSLFQIRTSQKYSCEPPCDPRVRSSGCREKIISVPWPTRTWVSSKAPSTGADFLARLGWIRWGRHKAASRSCCSTVTILGTALCRSRYRRGHAPCRSLARTEFHIGVAKAKRVSCIQLREHRREGPCINGRVLRSSCILR